MLHEQPSRCGRLVSRARGVWHPSLLSRPRILRNRESTRSSDRTDALASISAGTRQDNAYSARTKRSRG
jgi:hypothetical protein